MSECKRVRELLALRPAEWSADERLRVETHLATCADCADLARVYAGQERVIQSAPRARLTNAQRDHFFARIRRETRRRTLQNRISTALGAAAAGGALIALALGLYTMLSGSQTPTGSAPQGPISTRVIATPAKSRAANNADEALWFWVDAAHDPDLAHRTTAILQRQPWWDGEIVLFTYEDRFPESEGGGRQKVLSWVLAEPDPDEPSWTVSASGNKEVHWLADQAAPNYDEWGIFTFWLSERQDSQGRTMSVIYGLWFVSGENPETLKLTWNGEPIDVPLHNDSFLYVVEGEWKKRPEIMWRCDHSGGGVCGVGLRTDEPLPILEPIIFAGEIRGDWQSLDPLTGKLDSLYFGGPNVPEERSAPGQLSVPVDLGFTLPWQVIAPPSTDWRVFVHMLNEAGEVVMQSDVAVDWPDQTCLESEYDLECTVTSEHQWYFPADLPRGLYTIVAGLYDPETGERALLTSPSGAKSPVTLGQVWVVNPAQATLRVFSGRPNPTWTLTPTQTTELQARLASLTATDQPFDDSGWLGYAGLVLLQPESEGAPAQTILADRGIVRIENGDQVTLWADPNRSVERWLLDTAAGQVEEAVIEAARQEIDALVIHVVREGDTLQSIAARYGVSAEELLRTNDLKDPAELRVGWALVIPPLSPPVEPQGFAIYPLAEESAPTCVGTPMLSLDDILTYDWDMHAMTLTDAAYARLAGLHIPVAPGIPFVACVDSAPIYTGAFWTPLSSASFDGIVIEVLPTTENRPLRIQLGYPESPEMFTGEDLRGDPRILQSLEAANKLLPWP